MDAILYFIVPPWSRRPREQGRILSNQCRRTENILRVSIDKGVRRFIHFSSVAVYGMNPPDGSDETTPYQPCGNLYCDTKIASEKVVWTAHHETRLPVVVIRPTNVYGPCSNPWTVRPIKLINSGQMILINGGTGICNYVYIDNLLMQR